MEGVSLFIMRYAFFLIMGFNSFLLSSQQALHGTLLDNFSGDPLIGAYVQSGESYQTITDENGQFTLYIDSFPFLFNCSYIGYEKINKQFTSLDQWNISNVFRVHPVAQILDAATVTASRYEQRLAESNVSIELLKPELIEHTVSSSLDEVLVKVPGVEIIGGQANIRGGSGFSYGAGSRVMLLIDDIPALQADAGYPNWNDLPIENIAQVEIVKGAVSALYGSSALNGIINLRSTFPGSEPQTSVAIFSGYYGEPSEIKRKWWDKAPYSMGFTAKDSRKINKLDINSSLFAYTLSSYNKDSYENRGRLSCNARYRLTDRQTIGLNINLNITDNQDFFYWNNAVSGAYQANKGTLSHTSSRRFYIDPQYTSFDKFDNRHRILSRIFTVRNNSNDNRSIVSNLLYLEYQFQRSLTKKWKWSAGLVQHASYTSAELYSNDQYSAYNSAVYAQLDRTLTEGLNITIGSRFEFNALESPSYEITDTTGETTTFPAAWDKDSKPVFRFGVNYRLSPATFLRFSVGQGYRYPTIAEKYTATEFGSFKVFPNRNLNPETGWNTELGLKQGISLFGLNSFVDLSGFWSEYYNMMEFTFASQKGEFGFQSQNIGNIRIKGLELSGGGASKFGAVNMNFIGGVSYIDPTYIDFTESIKSGSSVDYNILKYRSKWNTKIDVEFSYLGFGLGGGLRYVSNMEAIDSEFNDFIAGLKDFRRVNDNGYKVVDIRGIFEMGHIKTIISCQNLLNNAYMVRPGLLEAPRNYALRLEYLF